MNQHESSENEFRPAGGPPAAGWHPPTDPANTSMVWGAPPAPAGTAPAGIPGKKLWTPRRGLAAAGVAVLVAAGGGAAVYAASAHSTSGTVQSQLGGQSGTLPGGGTAGGAGTFGAMAAAIHGEYVVVDNGRYVTMLTQTGEITALSSTSVSVKSADGVSLSYALGSTTTVASQSSAQAAGGQMGGPQSTGADGGQAGPPGAAATTTGSLSDLAVGKTVRITATKAASGNTAESIVISTAAASTAG